MLTNPLFGLKLIVVEDRVETLVLPRTRVKTASVRKAYNRLRRRTKVKRTLVHRFEDVAGAECVMAGDTVHLSPRGMAKLRTSLEEAPPAVFPPPSMGTVPVVSTSDVTAEKLLELMEKFAPSPRLDIFDARNLEMLTRPPALPADLFGLPEGASKFRYVKDDYYGMRVPCPTLLLSCF